MGLKEEIEENRKRNDENDRYATELLKDVTGARLAAVARVSMAKLKDEIKDILGKR